MIGNALKIIGWLYSQDKDQVFEIKKQRKKRTKDQNSYYHELKNKLSEKTGIPPIEIHKEMIFKSCPFTEFLMPYEADLRAIEYYYEKPDVIMKKGKKFKVVSVYVGSHLLNTSEFKILLENMIDECHRQGISTITPQELEKMRYIEESGAR